MWKKLAVALLIAGVCSGCLMSQNRYLDHSEESVRIRGIVDQVSEREVYSTHDGEVVITLIGFADGNGLLVHGIHPGMSSGKSIELHARRLDDLYKGTPVYSITKIVPYGEAQVNASDITKR